MYAYDGQDLVEETSASGTVVARYTQTQNIDEPLAMLRSGTTSFYDADGLGSITSLTNSSGAIAGTYAFDSFGNQTASTGTLTNPFHYTARELDSETGLYFYRARYYDATIGRFLGEDPLRALAGSPNFYGYTLNDPTKYRDPQGLDIAVIENGPTKNNPVGHTAIAVTGQGVFSFGNDADLGSSFSAYLFREALRRDTTVTAQKQIKNLND
jgi:RHS repeat-associated protein